MFSEKIFGISIPPKTQKFELTRELRELLFSSPSVLRELKEVALQDEKVSVKTERKPDRSKRSSETDNKMAFAIAFTVIESIHGLKEKRIPLEGSDMFYVPNNNSGEKRLDISSSYFPRNP